MVNRILIRIKVLQIVYAYHQNGNGDLKSAENDLQFSLKKSYELYLAFFLLLIEVTRLQNRILASKKEKYIPTEEELNPNMRFVNNRFIALGNVVRSLFLGNLLFNFLVKLAHSTLTFRNCSRQNNACKAAI